MTINRLAWIIAVLAFLSCNNNQKHGGEVREQTTLQEVEIFSPFPVHINAGFPSYETDEIIGIYDIRSDDNYIVAAGFTSEDKLVRVYSADDFSELGRFINKGRHLKELRYSAFTGGNALFINKDGHVIAIFECDGVFRQLDITESLAQGREVITIVQVRGTTEDVYNAHLEGDLFLLRTNTYENERTRMLRSFRDGNTTVIDVAPAKRLDQDYIQYTQDTWRLFTKICYNPRLKRVVEAPVKMNVMNIYSLDGTFQRSLSHEKKKVRLSQIEKENSYSLKSFFGTSDCSDSCFALVYHNAPQCDIDNQATDRQRIQIFDWDGNPLAEIKLDRIIRIVHMDFKRNRLLALDYNDRIVSYDIDWSFINNAKLP